MIHGVGEMNFNYKHESINLQLHFKDAPTAENVEIKSPLLRNCVKIRSHNVENPLNL